MKSKFTISMLMACAIFFAGCSKDEFSEQDAVNAQKELLNLKYQHELDLETLKQKGATAMQQMLNAAALEQLKLNDSLATKSAIEARKADYSIAVTDYYSNSPIVDADVTVSSQGKLFSAKTNEQGVATFTALYLFPTSTFLVSKTGYAATRINQQYLGSPVRLWNNTDITNEVSGTLYIETDLTNATPEKVGANVLVTASTNVAASTGGSYNVYFPTYTDANGAYSLKLPASPTGYSLTFEQITADQKLYVNATEDNPVTTFPASLPRLETIKTYFNVNSYTATVPAINNYYYFKIAPDKNGKIVYLPGNGNYGYNSILVSAVGDKFQVERLNVSNYNPVIGNYIDVNSGIYDPNTKIDVELVDITGSIVQTAPKLSASTGTNGRLITTYSSEGGNGYVHLKRESNGTLVQDAKGSILRAVSYDSFSNLYTLSFATNLNTTSNRFNNNASLSANKGDKKVVNFYYGSGDSRVKQVF